jgi:hypothetical protein
MWARKCAVLGQDDLHYRAVTGSDPVTHLVYSSLSLGSSRPRTSRGVRQHTCRTAWRTRQRDQRGLARPLAWVLRSWVGRGASCHEVNAARPPVPTMEALVISTLVVALGEIGDKTQLLSLLLAARFQRPVPIILGILSATLANHLLAGFVGEWVRNAISPDVLRLVLGGSFLALAAWTLVPDKMDDHRAPQGHYACSS